MKTISEKSIRSLERLENNYKLIYTVIMSVPLITALQDLSLKTDLKTGVWNFKGWINFDLQSIVIFIIFLFFYTRFFLGDLRLLDLKYLEHQHEASYQKRYSSFSRFIDFFSLIIHAIFFFILSSAITNFYGFFETFIMILMINTIWLSFVYLNTSRENRQRVEARSSLNWIMNNLICSLFLVLLFISRNFLPEKIVFWAFVTIAGLNTILDFSLAWRMYFPKIQEDIID